MVITTQPSYQSHLETIASFDGEKLWVEVWTNYSSKTTVRPVDLILVHGLAGDTAAYHWIIIGLMEQATFPLRVITYDQRGHGLSSRRFPAQASSVEQVLAKDLRHLIAQYRCAAPILAGQSLFGLVIGCYLNLPQNISPAAVIVMSPALKTPAWSINPRWWYHQLVRHTNQPPLTNRKRTPADHLKHKMSFDFSLSRLASDMYYTGPLRYALLWLSVFGRRVDSLDLLNQTTTHYWYGRYDWVVPSVVQRRFLKQLTKVQAEELPTNHNCIVNTPELLVPRMLEVCLKSR